MKRLDRIYLIGMPASGKTTLGKQLAKVIQYKFFDIDQLIAIQEGISILDIFVNKGEKIFRQLETQILQNTLPIRSVLATGGGTPQFHNNMLFMLQHGIVIFLDIPLYILVKRIIAQGMQRPLFLERKEKELLRKIKLKYRARIFFYQKADIRIKKENPQISDLINKIKTYCTIHYITFI